ncbi:ABC-type transport system involved in cytochrome c biogenesis permease subunit [Anaerobacterium chartisolvens]|uniref:ABC-type transport system involved in cytochrome c biogenesis permease subunit n=1 Tax=Anaerobacterium chartisolvens TaxID=1297424 RepID=A0A369AJG6_9FIRM|nr:cytochrome c biogenesis protein CcsA [Anaerobacterium chartisolvens]RCX08488.1 ABC-type transport system involved in cytochrome c biogenesis permease subunit [Anaerobacterium chartisolvens]
MSDINLLVLLLIISSASLYLLSSIVIFMKKKLLGNILLAAGWVLGIMLFIENWILVGYPPFANMYHVLTFLSLCFLPLYIILALREKLNWLLPYFCIASMFPLIGVLFMERQVIWERPPALQSIWFVPHVLSYMISYALATVAFILAIASAIKADSAAREDFSKAIYHVLRLGFPFMTTGLFLGAVWAEEAWGNYWSWDTKETWSLITWLLYLLYFHSIRSREYKKWSKAFHICAFGALLVTFLMVNLLPQLGSILHSYTK